MATMPFVAFRDRFRDMAERETRSVTLLKDSGLGLPAGDYGFIELFCDELGCDCRRVLFSVFSTASRSCEAVINFGWEGEGFYADWMKEDDPDLICGAQGSGLALRLPAG
ncbi:MAG: hypothetical protein ABIP94_06375 [Planctomycetota bacterium]